MDPTLNKPEVEPLGLRIAVFEDDPIDRRDLLSNLDWKGHHVVGIATNVTEAQELIPGLGELGVQVAIVDGNLTPWNKHGEEGRQIIEQIKELFPEIVTIGWGGLSLSVSDYDIGKGVGPGPYLATLDSILEKINRV